MLAKKQVSASLRNAYRSIKLSMSFSFSTNESNPSSSTDHDHTCKHVHPPPPLQSPPVMALSRKHLATELDEADVNFEVLALRNKSNARISLRHIRAEQRGHGEEQGEGDGNTGSKEPELDIKHTAPQHRRYLTHSPAIGSGTPSNRAKAASRLQLHRAATLTHKYQLEQLGYVDDEVTETALTMHKGINAVIGKVFYLHATLVDDSTDHWSC
jgi:hypothetical protein